VKSDERLVDLIERLKTRNGGVCRLGCPDAWSLGNREGQPAAGSRPRRPLKGRTWAFREDVSSVTQKRYAADA
jgi:hypothetical protein